VKTSLQPMDTFPVDIHVVVADDEIGPLHIWTHAIFR
jgi:hypothetical protein